MDLNLVIGVGSLLVLVALVAFFGYAIREQEANEPKEIVARGVALLRQHFPAGATQEQPTPYWVAPIPASPDPLEISANLDKKILAGAGMLMTIFALTGAYFFAVPGVRAKGAEVQLEQRVERGKNIYANLCFDCHGKTGEGITGAGLPLNIPQNKYEELKNDPTQLKAREFLLQRTIERGRQKPLGSLSMPPWAQSESGPLNPEQIQQVLAFIEHATDEEWHDIVTVRVEGHLGTEPKPPKAPALPTGAEGGLALTKNNPQAACTTCHSFESGKNSTLPDAPNLFDYGVKGPLSTQLKALKDSGDPLWLTKWVEGAPLVKPGISMPSFSTKNGGQLTDENIKAIVEYLQVLGTGKEPK